MGPGRNEVPVSAFLPSAPGGKSVAGVASDKSIEDHLAVQAIIRSYQVITLTKDFILFLIKHDYEY